MSSLSMREIEICNMSLLRIGAAKINSIDDNNLQTQTAKSLYPMIRDAVLSSYTWSFATFESKLTLAKSEDSMHFYSLPSNFLRAINVSRNNSNSSIQYDIQGEHIVSTEKDISLQYIARVEEDKFPPYFLHALTSRLSADFCLPLIDSTSRSEMLYKLAELELQKARGIDNQQLPPQKLISNILLGGRE